MRPRSKYIITICLIVFMHFNVSFSDSSESDPYPSVEIPVYHKAYNVTHSFNYSKHTKSLRYRVQTDHPANDVIEFYDAYLTGRGWTSSFEICQRNWGDLSDDAKTDDRSAKQLFASWQHLEFKLKLDLWLRSERVSNDQQDDVVVNCLLQTLGAK